MHYLLTSWERWQRNKGLKACRAWEPFRHKQNDQFLSFNSPGLESIRNVAKWTLQLHLHMSIIVLNLVMIAQPWLKRMSRESGKVARKRIFCDDWNLAGPIYPLKMRLSVKNNETDITFFSLFSSIFSTVANWERIKPEFPKEGSQRLILAIFGILDTLKDYIWLNLLVAR